MYDWLRNATPLAGFTTTAEVLYTPLRPLSERLRLPEHECRELVQAIVDERKKRWITEGRSKSVAQQLRELAINVDGDGSSIRELLSLTVGDHGIRTLLGGGLLPGTLTEVTGEA